MARYTQESIQRLRDAVDIIDLISRYVPLKRSGAAHKGRCPFHDEKTPSFVVQSASKSYHCFGCGAHGDALSFLMQYEHLDFKGSLEFLSERYGVALEVEQNSDVKKGPSKVRLRQVMEEACRFFHVQLLYSKTAEPAREYLYSRGISLEFVQMFAIGFAPAQEGLKPYLLSKGFRTEELREVGLIGERGREFFSERIVFPILDTLGHTVGFSARKYREETFGGKYINTPETALFKKGKILFGLFHSKKRIVKGRKACLVEGQLDALRLIEAGFDFTVATLGTAFGPAHVDQLRALGVEEVYVAFDQDEAGVTSAEKVGHMLMKKGIGARVVTFEGSKDPDELLHKGGKVAVFSALSLARPYIEYLVESARKNWSLPQEINRGVQAIASKIREWESPILVYESLKQLAALVNVPEKLLEIGGEPTTSTPVALPKPSSLEKELTFELDLIRWLVCSGKARPEVFEMCSKHLSEEDFLYDVSKQLFSMAMQTLREDREWDMLNVASQLDTEDVSEALEVLVSRKVQIDKAPAMTKEAVERIKQRNWMSQREAVRKKMEEPGLGDDELLSLAKSFDELTRSMPKV